MRVLAASLAILLMAGSASALLRNEFRWSATTGTGSGVGTDTIEAAPGDILTLELTFVADEGEQVGGAFGVSVAFDADGSNELKLLDAVEHKHMPTFDCTPFPTCYVNFGQTLTNLTPGVNSSMDSGAGTAGFINTFEQTTLGCAGVDGPVVVRVGTITFEVNEAFTDGEDIMAGFFNEGVDAMFNDENMALLPAFFGARVNAAGAVVPEPGTAVLVGVGLATLASRRRSS